MKKSMTKITKRICYIILALYMLIITKPVYAYKIHNKVVVKEDLGSYEYTQPLPEMIYKKQTAAYPTTSNKYTSGGYNKDEHGWVYVSNGSSFPDEVIVRGPYEEKKDPDSFWRIYEYFHKNQNSNYNTTDTSLGKKYFQTGDLWPGHTKPAVSALGVDYVYNVYGETNGYQGVYGAPDLGGDIQKFMSFDNPNIHKIANNLWRFAVIDNVFVSDNRLTSSDTEAIANKFGDESNSKELTIYQSSILRIGPGVDKKSSGYYKNIDTAYKFWETTIYGNWSSGWAGSVSVIGGADSLGAAKSALNYYDNTFVIPKGQSKKVYVRHIDVTGKTEIKSNTIDSSMILQNIKHSHAMQLSGWDSNGVPKFYGYLDPTNISGGSYTEYYEKNLNNKAQDLIVGNVRYSAKNSNNETMYALKNSSSDQASYSDIEKQLLNEYNCIGAVVGRGDNLTAAQKSRDDALNASANLTVGSTDYYAAKILTDTGDKTNIHVSDNEIYDCIVIDFYYQKPQAGKEIYVRHIDVTGKTEIKSSTVNSSMVLQNIKHSQAMQLSGWDSNGIPILSKYMKATTISGGEYSEYYKKPLDGLAQNLIVGNVKYSANTSGGTVMYALDNTKQAEYSDIEKQLLNEYNCIGAIVGRGSSLEGAQQSRDAALNASNNLTISSTGYGAGKIQTGAGDKTNVHVSDTDTYDYIVIDFYYQKPQKTEIYVRHIDVTGKTQIKTSTINNSMILQNIKHSQAMQLAGWDSNGAPNFSKYIKATISTDGAYNEYYKKTLDNGGESLIVGNVKYSANTSAGTIMYSLDNTKQAEYSEIEKKLLNEYNCIGAVVGRGYNLVAAQESRNAALDASNNLTVSSTDYYAAKIQTGTGDKTNIHISDADKYNYVVIDFYYQKPQKTEIYVRHIDVTGKILIKSHTVKNNMILQDIKHSQAMQLAGWDSNGVPNFSKYIKASGSSDSSYTEYYQRTLDTQGQEIIVGNAKYSAKTSNNTRMYALDNTKQAEYSEIEKKLLNEYNCIGAIVGRGGDLEAAKLSRDYALDASNNLKISSTVYGEGKIQTGAGDKTNVHVSSTETYNCIVIDFYYQVPSKPISEVWVRHIDVTDCKNNITANNIDNLINQGKVLAGTGKAKLDGTTDRNAEATNTKKYQEKYTFTNSSTYMDVYKDQNELYKCIGTNMVSSLTSLVDAENKMDVLLNSSSKYDSNKTDVVKALKEKEIIIIDFYYVSRSSGKLLEREKVGRLSFNTVDGKSDNFEDTVNDETNDKIPSNEYLRTAIQGTYKYMLGGINIQKQTVSDDYKLQYTIKQPYYIDYKIWLSCCDYCGAYYTEDMQGKPCKTVIKIEKDEGGYVEDEKTVYCKGKDEMRWDYDYKWASDYEIEYNDWIQELGEDAVPFAGPGTIVGTGKNKRIAFSSIGKFTPYTGTVDCEVNYVIPCKYTFYKIKNLRIYTISKMELLDGYMSSVEVGGEVGNAGLPLFDGRTHIINTSDSYNESIIYFNSSNKQSLVRVDKTGTDIVTSNSNKNVVTATLNLATTLNYAVENEYNMEGDKIKRYPIENMLELFKNNMTHTKAAKISDFKLKSETKEYDDDDIKATEYIYDGIETEGNLNYAFKANSDYIWLYGTYLIDQDERSKGLQVDLSEYTKNKKSEVTDNGSKVTISEYDVTDEDKKEVTVPYPSSLRGKYGIKADDTTTLKKTKIEDFSVTDSNGEYLLIPISRLNGIRYNYGKVYYNLANDKNLNFDSTNSGTVDCNESNKSTCQDWNSVTKRTAVSGNGGETFIDTELHNDKGVQEPEVTTIIKPGDLQDIVWEYGKDMNDNTEADTVNVFTPISFSTEVKKSTEPGTMVNHTSISDASNIIQKNSRFTIEMTAENVANVNQAGYDTNKVNTNDYIDHYYIKFNFDVQNIRITDALGTEREYHTNYASKDTWIGPIYNQNELKDGEKGGEGTVSISAIALADPNDAAGVVNQKTNSYEVYAVANNYPKNNNFIYNVLTGNLTDPEKTNFITKTTNKYNNSTPGKTHQNYYNQKNIKGHSNYVAKEDVETTNVSRIYDFKVTDLKDVDWKNIFRQSTSSTTNVHTSKAYYAGVNKWDIYSTQVNDLLIRDVSEIGATRQQTLPLGPYKNANSTYTGAPKLGYKFSFDLKTTGEITGGREKRVIIDTKFFYISKDGKKYIPNDKLKLFYKNSSNKYVDIANYKLYFVPNDGYRLTFDSIDHQAYRFNEEESKLAKSTVHLGNAKKLKLTKQMMQQADQLFVQIWYGEYKLPNSTIAVEIKDGKYNINNPLKDGYIGVIFDIRAEEYEGASVTNTIKYNIEDSSADPNDNTSQWDYEGYLGFNSYGNVANNLSIPLEKGVWSLNDTTYNEIKGTVILYDTDAKASSDYD